MPIPAFGFSDNNPAIPASSATMESFLQYIAGFTLNSLTPTATKTANYTAVGQDFVKASTAGGAFTVSLPNAPADGTMVAVQLVTTGSNLTIQAQGTDTVDVQGGVASFTLSQQDETVILRYRSTGTKWSVLTHSVIGGGAGSIIPQGTVGTNLGATQTINFASTVSEVWLTGTLNANLTVTMTNRVAGCRAMFLLTQDGTGGRTLTVSDGTTSAPVVIAPGAGTLTMVEVKCPDATTIDAGVVGSTGMNNPMTTAGDLIVAGASGVPGRLAKGSDGTVLTMVTGSESWVTPATGFTNPMTTAGDLIVGGASGAATRLAKGADGTVLTMVSGSEAWATSTGGQPLFVPTAVKTSSYTAAPNDFVPVDASASSVTITLPTAPADKTRIAVKDVKGGLGNAVSVATGGSDVFNIAAGSVSLTLSNALQGVVLQYASASSIWYVQSADLGNNPIGKFQTFTSNGTFTIPVGATLLEIIAVAGHGGGGGGGSQAAAAVQGGGGGGGSGTATIQTLPVGSASLLTITIGTGGTGGTGGAAAGANGGDGVAGGTTTVTGTGISVSALGGGGGTRENASVSTVTRGGAYGGGSAGNVGGSSVTTVANQPPGCGGTGATGSTSTGPGGSALGYASGGGGGGGPSTTTNGGNGGGAGSSNGGGTFGTGTTGTANGGAGTNGASGVGGGPGGGGGGGTGGTGTGGAGGTGGSGYVIVKVVG